MGDHIICNGLVRSLIKEGEEYTLFVKPHNITSVKFMYRDLKNLHFELGDDSYVNNFIVSNKITNEDLIIAGFNTHPQAKEFDDSFYLQNNLPFSYRWDKFYVERDLDSEKKLFQKFNMMEQNYVFIHDDHSRGYKIDESKIIKKNLKIVRPIIGLTDNIFDYCYLMEHSSESHFIDSSFRLMFDSLKLRNNNIFYHYTYPSVYRNPSKSQSFLNFIIV